MKIYPLIMAATFLCLTACGPQAQAPAPAAPAYPKGSIQIRAVGGYLTTLVPVQVDGVRCIVGVSNSAASSLQCDFRSQK